MFTDGELRLCQDFVIELATNAGHLINQAFSARQKSFSEKSSRHDLFTETDAAVENYILSRLREKYPLHRFIGEETSSIRQPLTDEPTWMIDPIDGTMNFIHGNPCLGISIGLLIQKTPILGVIYNPITNDLYSARINGGAYKNGEPIRVSQAPDLAHSLLLTGFGKEYLSEKYSLMSNIVMKTHGIRTVGSVALHMAAVASGASDCTYDFGLHCWDMAAGAVIVREAGGVVLDTSGDNLDIMSRRMLCAANPLIAKQLVSYLENVNLAYRRD